MRVNLKKLNPQQREAVLIVDGPVLVVAGAGTGKTRTIAYRTAYMLERGIEPENILGITFTNKAARGMRDRVGALVGAETAKRITLSTIHSLCARMLREDIHHIGRGADFSIFDSSDQVGFVRAALVEMGLDPAKHDPRSLHFAMSQYKNGALAAGSADWNPLMRELFHLYNKTLEKNNALDFDDLLIYADKLLEKSSETLEKYRAKFQYIMVDEYQDINDVQYQLLRKLAGGHKNIYAVGDEDQSIYGWRGARMRHIMSFEKDFPGAKIVKLERNYRSTKQILDAANSVISCNIGRRPKKLVTDKGDGFPVCIIDAENDREEAATVVERVMLEKHKTFLKYKDFAVLFRTNAQSRLFEEALINRGVRYVLVGGTKFYERKEIKDVLSYMRLAANPMDMAAFERVVNYPARGIGGKSLETVYKFAAQKKITPLEALSDEGLHALLPEKARAGAVKFTSVIRKLGENHGRLSDSIKLLIKDIGIEDAIQRSCETLSEAQARIQNMQELVSSVADYESVNAAPTLTGYLENAALLTEEKETDEDDLKEDCVALMTLHSCKGLEFPVVFLVGAEERLIPHERSMSDIEELEEERRLFYVGMTRAMKRLFISWSKTRRKYGETVQCRRTRFLGEMDSGLVEREDREQLKEETRAVHRESALKHLENMRKMLDGK